MRRVDRGPWPETAGERKSFARYRRAKRDLLDRLGAYRSYCERTGDLHVEHVVPKHHRPDLAGEWTNFLLGCVNCNSIKLARNNSRDGYTWPDDDVAWSPFKYLPEGVVQIADDLAPDNRAKAERLFQLVGLGRRPTTDPTASDLRYLRRQEAWRTAELAQRASAGSDTVVPLAKATGFWSVWMTVFEDQPGICAALREAFAGTR